LWIDIDTVWNTHHMIPVCITYIRSTKVKAKHDLA
jgi:hypothetical protein